ncbi:MAG: hypothetical protein C0412_05440 [Flavobacterium sp.]|nr:hypothetical protein [Flavobacterium sp.]
MGDKNELDGLKKEMLIIDLVKANIFALFSMIPIVLIYGIPYYLVWSKNFTLVSFREIIRNNYTGVFSGTFSILLIMILGIVVHELIHGITWARFTKKGHKSIKYGVLWKMLTPYCHCKEPLLVKHYIIGAITPAIILGFLPAIYSILTGNIGFLIFGIFFTMAALGDFMIIYLLRKENRNSFVLDHPSEAGCFVYRKQS